LLLVMTQAPSQSTVPLGQSTTHSPLAQRRPAPQALPQPPQLAGSELMVVQVSPQRICPAPHEH
jgi:hypothetical protein